jgi:hypothetical protein
MYSQSCPEVAVVGTTLASCSVIVHASVKIVPILNAAGRLVGCTSGGSVQLTSSYVYFNSTVDVFDNSSIDDIFVGQIYDSFSDGSPGVFQFTAVDQGQSSLSASYWLVNGAFTGSCKRGAYYLSGTGTGTVDVQI